MRSSIKGYVGAASAFAAAVLVSILVHVPTMSAGPNYTGWDPPVNLGPVINTSFTEAGPHLSKDRRSLYFYSVRPRPADGVLDSNIWVAERDNVDEESWGTPQLVTAVNSTAAELSPSLSRDQHWLFFTRVGTGGRDIWMSYREDVHDNFAWQTPVSAGAINTSSDETDASYFENEDGLPQLFFTRGADIYVSPRLPDGTFGLGTAVSELNTPVMDRGLSIRFDGLEAFFFSNRIPNVGMMDMWTATRQSTSDPWSQLTSLSVLNTTFAEGEPDISSDRETLYFNSNRTGPGTFGAMDLYVTHRRKANPNKEKP